MLLNLILETLFYIYKIKPYLFEKLFLAFPFCKCWSYECKIEAGGQLKP